MFLISEETISRFSDCSVLNRTSATPNKPITSGTMPMPSIRWMLPKVRRGCALMLSRPMSPSTRPRQAMNSAFAIEPCVRKVSMTRPSTIRLKYSAGPNAIATSASRGAISIKRMIAKVPAMKEPSAEMPSAGPARPRFAISWPSRHVTTEAASPGMLTRIDVVDPPYIAAVVDAGHHDDAGLRRAGERHRQQQRHRRDRADAGQHADQRADEHADEAVQQVDRLQRDAETLRDEIESIHDCPLPDPQDARGQLDEQQLLQHVPADDSGTSKAIGIARIHGTGSMTRNSATSRIMVEARKPSVSNTSVKATSSAITSSGFVQSTSRQSDRNVGPPSLMAP